MMGVRQEVRAFFEGELKRDLGAVDDGTSLLEAGILDSLGVMQLVAFLERRYGLAIAEEDMVPENLASVDGIAGLVTRLQSQVA